MARNAPLDLLRTRRFLPLFGTQALGAFNDNLFKQAMALLLVFHSGMNAATLTAVASAILVAPYIFFSAFAGSLADRMDKGVLARRLKISEIAIVILGAWALLAGSFYGLFGVLFLLGCQATLFGTVKYALLPAHLRDQELVSGNALIEGATFLAILIGSILGGLLIGQQNGVVVVSVALGIAAVLGYLAAWFIPPALPFREPNGALPPRVGTFAVLREARTNRTVWLSILGISWFWTVGSTVLSFVPALAKDLLGGSEPVVSTMLGTFSVGIAVGSMLCARRLKGRITPEPVPFAALAISALLIVFAIVTAALPAPAALNQPALDVLAHPSSWLVILCLFALAVAAGFYAVPLFAVMQHAAPEDAKARTIGANNIVNALFMVAGAIVVAALSSGLGLSLPWLALILAVLNLVAAAIMVKLLSRMVLKAAVRGLMSFLYGVEVTGEENFARAGAHRVVIANHQSFLDGMVVAAFLPGDPVFAVDTGIAKKWWVRPLLAMVDFATIDPTNPFALKSLAREVDAGRTLVIFPEGRLTVTGSLMKVYDGPGLVADKTGADLIPVRLDGLQYTYFFTRLRGGVKRHLTPKVRMAILPPVRLTIDEDVRGRARRKIAGRRLYDIMSDMMFRTSVIDQTLFRALAAAGSLNGRAHVIAEDVQMQPLTYGRLMAGAFVLAGKLKPLTAEGETIGVLLPNSVGALVTFFALQAIGRVPAMLNVSAGAGGMIAACRVAQVKTVLCSKIFVEKGKLQPIVDELAKAVEIVWLDDVRESIGTFDKLWGLAKSHLPSLAYRDRDPNGPAVVVFTSGSEGVPKGVVLSHRNLHANRHQVGARIAFNTRDIAFNAMPMFHSFGLTVGTLLPVLSGIRTFFYPSPLHYRIIPELIYQTNATLFFATDTFLRGYARTANPYDFHSLRIVGAGAERVSDETRRLYSERFGIRILEGYGATECSPVIAFNTPMHLKYGTVGRIMPGIDCRLEPVQGIEGGGKLVVRGPNVMLGYYRDGAPGVLEPVEDGWYDTGDIVAIDDEGFVAIKGRAKRFAKIAGEMVSLGAVEDLAAKASPSFRHAAIARPDARRGEQIVLISEDPALTRDALARAAAEAKLPEIMLPREIFTGREIPVLGTGKTDYPTLAALMNAETQAAA